MNPSSLMFRRLPLVLTLLCAACATPLKMDGGRKSTAPAKSASARPAAPSTNATDKSAPAKGAEAQATALLNRVNSYTNMSDAQFARVQQATDSLNSGQAQRALDLLQPLEHELRSETKIYVVKPGDSLWTIAAQPEVYANAHLWPLLAEANADLLAKTNHQVQAGQKLKIKLHPTMDESIQALRNSGKGP